jgi:hypothetical protein
MPPPNTSLAAVLEPLMAARTAAAAAHEQHGNRLGRRIVADYGRFGNRYPGRDCFELTYMLVADAARREGVPLPHADFQRPERSVFAMLWGSYINYPEGWSVLPEKYRGKGAPGAMAWAGLGKLLEGGDIWAGKLLPGAVIQVWEKLNGYQEVRAGRAGGLGHSFIFLGYTTTGSAPTGMTVADSWLSKHGPVSRSRFSTWFGANHTSGDPPFIY